MKTDIKFYKNVVLSLYLVAFLACTPDDEMIESNGSLEKLPGVDLEEFETDQGERGITISARDIARKGYKPAKVGIVVNAISKPVDTVIIFDEFNNLVNLSFKNEKLSSEQQAELNDGVSVILTILDENNKEIVVDNISKISFTSSPSIVDIENNLTDLYDTVSIRENVLHYIQIVTKDNNEIYGAPSSELYPHTSNLGTPVKVHKLSDLDYNSEFVEKFTAFKFTALPNKKNVFTIKTMNGSDVHNLYLNLTSGQLRVQSKANIGRNGGNTDASKHSNYWFKIEKIEPGLFKIIPTITNNPLVLVNNNTRLDAGSNTTTLEPTYFRILAFDIDWDIQPIESKFMTPILPPNGTDDAYNSTLRNCSSGLLTQKVGKALSVETTEILGWEESMQISTTNDYSVSLTIGAEVETNFFGNKGKATSSVTGSYGFSTTKTNTSTRSGAFEKSESTSISFERTQQVPPKTAIVVADIFQTYTNVRIPYVQRFRIYGTYQDNGQKLSGDEIVTQFAFNSFTGVITEVNSDYIEVTVRGVNVINNLIKVETISRDVQGACN